MLQAPSTGPCMLVELHMPMFFFESDDLITRIKLDKKDSAFVGIFFALSFMMRIVSTRKMQSDGTD